MAYPDNMIIRLKKLGTSGGESTAFKKGQFKIGRSTANDLFLKDASVSRMHAELEVVDSENLEQSLNGSLDLLRETIDTDRLAPRYHP